MANLRALFPGISILVPLRMHFIPPHGQGIPVQGSAFSESKGLSPTTPGVNNLQRFYHALYHDAQCSRVCESEVISRVKPLIAINHKRTCIRHTHCHSTLDVSTTAKKKCDTSSLPYAVSAFCLLWFSTFSLAIEFVLQGE